jgi:hypothetical protein
MLLSLVMRLFMKCTCWLKDYLKYGFSGEFLFSMDGSAYIDIHINCMNKLFKS